MTFLKLIGLTLCLNVVRYVIGGPIEAVTIMEPMHRIMPLYPDVFDNDFTTRDFAISLGYNFMLWFSAVLAFHVAQPALTGTMLIRSAKMFGVLLLFFCSLAAIYMNHFVDAVKPFWFWSIIDALIIFPLLALANGLLYPRLFARRGETEPAAGSS